MKLFRSRLFQAFLFLILLSGILFFGNTAGVLPNFHLSHFIIFTFGVMAAIPFLLSLFKNNRQNTVSVIFLLAIPLYMVVIGRYLFGRFIVPVMILSLIYLLLPAILKLVGEKLDDKAFYAQRESKTHSIGMLKEIGYFDQAIEKRMAEFDTKMEALDQVAIDWEQLPDPQKVYLDLNDQLDFLEENAERMENLALESKRGTLEDLVDKIMRYSFIDNWKKDYYFPLNDSFKNYNQNGLAGQIIKNINHYNSMYREEERDYFGQLKGKKDGIEGEKRVNKEMELYQDIILNIPNVRLVVDGDSVESDNILITDRGIFSVEVKNYGSSGQYTLSIRKDGQWVKIYNEDDSEPTENVMSQVNRHIALKQRFLNRKLKEMLKDEGLDYVYIHPIIVIANDIVTIDNQTDLPIMRVANIYSYIMNFEKGSKVDKKYWPLVKEIFETNSLPAIAYPLTVRFEALETARQKILDQIKAYYVLCSMWKTFESDLERAGIMLAPNDPIISFKADIQPLKASEYACLPYKSAEELLKSIQ